MINIKTCSFLTTMLWKHTISRIQPIHLSSLWMSDKTTTAFDTKLLDVLACPLSKKPLRYDKTRNELVCDDIGVAYPIIDGIPNFNPADGQMLKASTGDNSDTHNNTTTS